MIETTCFRMLSTCDGTAQLRSSRTTYAMRSPRFFRRCASSRKGGAGLRRARPVRAVLRQQGRHREAWLPAGSRGVNRFETETFARYKMLIDNWAGKECRSISGPARGCGSAARNRRAVQEGAASDLPRHAVEKLSANRIIFHIQPRQAIETLFQAKVPGPTNAVTDRPHALRTTANRSRPRAIPATKYALQLHERRQTLSRARTSSRRPGASPSAAGTTGLPRRRRSFRTTSVDLGPKRRAT